MNPYEYLSEFKKYGKKGGFKPGLERVKKILSYFDNPQDKVDYIHIGGSNGKGSTVAIISSILREAGYQVGTYISPPLVHFNERFSINGKPISTKDLSLIVKRLKEVFDDPSTDIDKEDPSFFEIITVIAFVYFYEKNIDIGILEVGLGGRLDATNIIKKPLISIITNISYEHAEILGPRIKDIAYEKAGIIKENIPIITGAENEEALKVFRKIAQEKNSKLIVLNPNKMYNVVEKSLQHQIINLDYKDKILMNIKLNILGKHQIKNSALAVKSLEFLPERYPVDEDDITEGLKKCKWPGRLEVLKQDPDIILDGAHNVDGMQRLIEFLRDNIDKNKKILFILSILKEKEYKKMLTLIKELENEIELIITKNNNERSLNPIIIQEYADKLNINNIVCGDIYTSVKKANNILSENDVLCITGSLYTVAEARFYIYLLVEGGLDNGKK